VATSVWLRAGIMLRKVKEAPGRARAGGH